MAQILQLLELQLLSAAVVVVLIVASHYFKADLVAAVQGRQTLLVLAH
jgi:hypothetical protein